MIHFLPMGARVILVAYEGVQGLDVLGPAEVFAAVERRYGAPAYEVILGSVGGAAVRATSGVTLATRDLSTLRASAHDTVLVAGGAERAIRAAVACEPLVRWVERAARVVRRVGSVCSGAFVLARAGVLDGRPAATHWSACAALSAFRPQVQVNKEAIFVRDGNVWTSAGVTTGIDMALAIVEEDHGRAAADAIAARLVLYARRPGFQSQFSDALVAQSSTSDPFARAIDWARTNLRADVDVTRLARRAGMSVRSLHRRCLEELGTTPAKLVERLRVEQARTLLSTTRLGTKVVASRCGFGSAPRMARAFERVLGMPPRDYRVVSAANA
jgi:transcriptional regulator GlxA family with amidase domain